MGLGLGLGVGWGDFLGIGNCPFFIFRIAGVWMDGWLGGLLTSSRELARLALQIGGWIFTGFHRHWVCMETEWGDDCVPQTRRWHFLGLVYGYWE